MATRKRLGSSDPAATTETDLYNSPGAGSITDVVISAITVCNRGAAAGTFRISMCPEGDATGDDDYIAYDMAIGAKETVQFDGGYIMEPDWDLRVYSSTSDFSFQVWGQENPV